MGEPGQRASAAREGGACPAGQVLPPVHLSPGGAPRLLPAPRDLQNKPRGGHPSDQAARARQLLQLPAEGARSSQRPSNQFIAQRPGNDQRHPGDGEHGGAHPPRFPPGAAAPRPPDWKDDTDGRHIWLSGPRAVGGGQSKLQGRLHGAPRQGETSRPSKTRVR